MGIVMSYDAAVRERGANARPAPSVMLHEEPPGSARAAADTRARPSLLGTLVTAESSAERQRTVKAMLQSMGFEWLGYSRFAQYGDRLLPLSFCTTYADPRWARRYFNEAYHTVDPRLRLAPESGLPCVWTIDELEERAAADASRALLRRFVGELRDTGSRCGVVLAVPGGPPHERHFISLLSPTPGSQWINDGLLGQVLTLGLCLHEFYSRYAPVPQAEGNRGAAGGSSSTLTPLQCEILARVARGLADKQIAAQLDLSLHNVDYHMRQLRKRFGVRNRVQLMQAALGPEGSDAA